MAELEISSDVRRGRLRARWLAVALAFMNWSAGADPDAPGRETSREASGRSPAQAGAAAHWAWRPLSRPEIPRVRNERWPRTPVDTFVLAGLESAGLRPTVEATRRAWIRRVTFDLIGLPPTPEEIDAWLADASEDAEAKLVERLLASPHYGERWGRHWLDVVRYADTAGDSSDYPVPQAHKYRDYVIASFNRDTPYDRFLQEQIAGDLLPFSSQAERNEHLIATGFIALARRFGVTGREMHLTIEDTLEVLGRSTLGLSLSCARCHDHKYDPITMADYYGLYGIFSSTRFPHAGAEEQRRQADFPALLTGAEAADRERAHRGRVEEIESRIAEVEQSLGAIPEDAKARPSLTAEFNRLWRERDALNRNPLGADSAYAVGERGGTNARLQLRGDPNQPGAEVPRRFLELFGGQPVAVGQTNSGRLELAAGLTGPASALAARVMVNRVWSHHFGRGLVATPNDFGTRGARPTHPELLDWLASRFIESGWSIKSLHRVIVQSATYRQSARPGREAALADPDNERLHHVRRARLDAEQYRDALLAVSGRLERSPAGPHPFPAESEWNFTQHAPFSALYPTEHRAVYLMQPRLRKEPFLELFDGADPNSSTGARSVTITPPQALFALNDAFVHEQAAALADRLFRERSTDSARIDRAHQLAFGRAAAGNEIRAGLEHLDRVGRELARNGASAEQARRDAWASYARALLASSEFLFLD